MAIESASSTLATPVQQRTENRANEVDTQNRQVQQERQVREDNRATSQTQENRTERQEDRNSDFSLNQNRPISSINNTQDSESTQGQSQQQEPSQEQLAARTREQIEREFANVQNPNQGQSRLNIEV